MADNVDNGLGATQGPTFRDLKAEGKRHNQNMGASPQVLAADASALNSFMKVSRFANSDGIRGRIDLPEADFCASLRQYEKASGMSPRTVAPYRSRLRAWNELARGMTDAFLAPTAGMMFSEAVTKAMDAYLVRNPGALKVEIARAAGITPQFLSAIRRVGVIRPIATPKNVAAATRLEEVLGVSTGSLSSRLSATRWQRTVRTKTKLEADRKASNRGKVFFNAIRYRLAEMPPVLEAFFQRMEAWKSTSHVLYNLAGEPLERPSKTWRVVPSSNPPKASADIHRNRIRTIVGWLMLPTTEQAAVAFVLENCTWPKKKLGEAEAKILARHFIGKGLAADKITPAHLVDPEILGEFFEWRKARNGFVEDAYVVDAMMHLTPEVGFLAQQVELVWHYPKLSLEPVDIDGPDGIQAYLVRTSQWTLKAARWMKQVKGLFPFTSSDRAGIAGKRLQPILAQKDLMGVVDGIIQAHAAARPVGRLKQGHSGAYFLAVWVRDQLLLRMLASNPLRNRNFREMRYLEKPTSDDLGNLYRDANGGWRLRFQPFEMKNEKGAASELYDVPVPADLWPLVDSYILKARPILMDGKTTDAVFLNRNGKPFKVAGLSAVVKTLTGRYLQGMPDVYGFATHAFRHIIATAWLRAHPEDYLTVAHILHDKLQTVLDNYAHVTPTDGLVRYSGWLSKRVKPLGLDEAA